MGVPAVEHEHRWSLTHDAVFNRSPLRLSQGIHLLSSFDCRDVLGGVTPSKIIVASLPYEESLFVSFVLLLTTLYLKTK